MAVVAPFLPPSRLRVVAEEFLATHHPSGEIPVPVEEIIEFSFGLDIVPVPGLKSEYDVDAYITSDLTEIRVDGQIQKKYPNRYRFSLAHELAHLLVHKDVFAELRFATIAEWKAAMNAIPAVQYGYIESQAYCLAGLILVPAIPLNDVFGAKCDEAKAAGIDFVTASDDCRRIIERAVGDYFEVSGDVISRRLRAEKLGRAS
jgi:hypothetical protein